jgi:hypothetical protein
LQVSAKASKIKSIDYASPAVIPPQLPLGFVPTNSTPLIDLDLSVDRRKKKTREKNE